MTSPHHTGYQGGLKRQFGFLPTFKANAAGIFGKFESFA
jgi:hypothetical protein